jgi:hypothetical protein
MSVPTTRKLILANRHVRGATTPLEIDFFVDSSVNKMMEIHTMVVTAKKTINACQMPPETICNQAKNIFLKKNKNTCETMFRFCVLWYLRSECFLFLLLLLLLLLVFGEFVEFWWE